MAGGTYSTDTLLNLLGEVAKGSPYRGDAMLRHLFENGGRPLLDAYGDPIKTRDDTPDLVKDVGRNYMRLVVNEDNYKYVKQTKKRPGKALADVLDDESSWFNENAYATALQTVLGSFPDTRNRINKLDKISSELISRDAVSDDIATALERCRDENPDAAAEALLGLGRALFVHAVREVDDGPAGPATSDSGLATSTDGPAGGAPYADERKALSLSDLLGLLAGPADSPLGTRGWTRAEALDALLPDAVLGELSSVDGRLERALAGELGDEERTRVRDAICVADGLNVRRWRAQLASNPALDDNAVWELLAGLRAHASGAEAASLASVARNANGDAALALELMLALAVLGSAVFDPLARGVRAYL